MQVELFKRHITEMVGSAAGGISGIVAMINGNIHVIDDLHAVFIAFLTGAAGGLGALIVKFTWNKINKIKSRE